MAEVRDYGTKHYVTDKDQYDIRHDKTPYCSLFTAVWDTNF